MTFIEHFSNSPDKYKQFRPNYPEELFTYLATLVPSSDLAWDCGTGNGQAAVSLSRRFKQVIASDISQEQLDVAPKKDNITYHCWPAEKTTIPDASVDLITIAQALHWFDFDVFYQEVKRVSKPGGVIAAWCYSLGTVSSTIDPIIRKLYQNILGNKYWPKERIYVMDEYTTIPFPFQRISPPAFIINKNLNYHQMIGYLNTWSAVKEYQKQKQQNPVDKIAGDLQAAWGDLDHPKAMIWPIHLLVGRI